MLQEQGAVEFSISDLELDVLAKTLLSSLGRNMRVCCQQRGVELTVFGVVAKFECAFTKI